MEVMKSAKISEVNLKKISSLKIYKRETIDDVLSRIIHIYEKYKGELNKEVKDEENAF